MRHTLGYSLAVLLSLAIGCSGSHKVDVGEGHEPTAVTGESLMDYAGVWDGYAEAFTWNDSTDHVRITLDETGKGTFEVGEADPLPPPDPDHGYPPGSDDPYGKLTVANVPLLDGRRADRRGARRRWPNPRRHAGRRLGTHRLAHDPHVVRSTSKN
jgi:hypothetical protein